MGQNWAPKMQKSLKFILFIFTCFLSLQSMAYAQNILTSAWHKTKYSQARAHILQATANQISLAVEIKIIEKYKTYWQSPGSTGVPPIPTISGQNIVENSAKMQFPFPQKFVNKYGETWGYKDKMVLFVTVDRQKASQETKLDFTFNYAVCDEICLLEFAEFNLSLDANELAPTMSSLKFKHYKKQIPQAIDLANSAIISAKLTPIKQLVLSFKSPIAAPLFITDSKNRFYQQISTTNRSKTYSLHGLPLDDDYAESALTIHYFDNDGYYHTQIHAK